MQHSDNLQTERFCYINTCRCNFEQKYFIIVNLTVKRGNRSILEN